MNLSLAIENITTLYKIFDGTKLTFGTILNGLVDNYDLKGRDEKECLSLLNELIEEWINQDYIRLS